MKQLVDLHAGAISVISDGPGQGSTFVVRLPCLQAGQEEPAGVDASPA